MTQRSVHRRWSVYRPHFLRQDKDAAIVYVRGYILALEDVLNDNKNIALSQPGYTESWQLIMKVRQSLEEANRTLQILLHDKEMGPYPDGKP